MSYISFLALFSVSFASYGPSKISTKGLSAVLMKGTATGYAGKVPIIGCGEDGGQNCIDCISYPESASCIDADCFDVDLFDLNTMEKIGTGTDCPDVQVINDTCGQLLVSGTTIFRPYNLDSQHNQTSILVRRGKTTVQPVTTGSSEGYTHITSDIPIVDDNSILYGTGVFDGVTGPVELAGAVTMTESSVTFNCLFLLNLDDGTTGSTDDSTPSISNNGRSVVKLLGTGTAHSLYVPAVSCTGNCVDCLDPSYQSTADCVQVDMCYNVDLVDVASGKVIGTGTDCFMPEQVGIPGCGTLLVTATTFYNVSGVDGIIVSRGKTTVQPVSPGSSVDYTHITGAIAGESDNSILYGTGVYADVVGFVQLSGAVNMANIGSGEVMFNCIFALELSPRSDETTIPPMTTLPPDTTAIVDESTNVVVTVDEDRAYSMYSGLYIIFVYTIIVCVK